MRKRERENPCAVCGHYHKYEEGEVCGVCGHRALASSERPIQQSSAFPSEILKGFLYLGSYDNASRGELLKALGITHVLNTVPACQNLYKNSFTYYCLQDDKVLQFDEAIQFLEQCEKGKARVLVHCMSGRNRSPAIVIAYLMKYKGWQLTESFQWVKDRRPVIELSSAVQHQLLEYERRIFGCNGAAIQPPLQSGSPPSFGFGFPREVSSSPLGRVFNQQPAIASIFERRSPNKSVDEFVFGAVRTADQRMAEDSTAFSVISSSGTEAPMDSS